VSSERFFGIGVENGGLALAGLTGGGRGPIFNQLTAAPAFPSFFPALHRAGLGDTTMSKRTFQPNNRRRAKVHGFRLRMRTRAGRAIIAARRRKGRTELSA